MSRIEIRKAHRDEAGFGLVEVLIALVIMAVGLIAVGGLHVAVADQQRAAEWRTGQTLAATEVFDRMRRAGFAAAVSGTDTVTIGKQMYSAKITVNTTLPRVKLVAAQVGGNATYGSRTFVTRIYAPRQLPPAP